MSNTGREKIYKVVFRRYTTPLNDTVRNIKAGDYLLVPEVEK